MTDGVPSDPAPTAGRAVPAERRPAEAELAEYATLDYQRERRQGLPEVIYGPGKTPQQIAAIGAALLAAGSGPVFATRIEPAVAEELRADHPQVSYLPAGRLLVWRRAAPTGHSVAIVTAGTADGQVAAEAAAVATVLGLQARLIPDVGVAGLHRLLARLAELRQADVVVVVAGMEAALASVVGGLVAAPVIAVPTSTGYGAALDGITALLGMLSSCASGITVVNIDSGFSAAMAAHRAVATEHRAVATEHRAADAEGSPPPAHRSVAAPDISTLDS